MLRPSVNASVTNFFKAREIKKFVKHEHASLRLNLCHSSEKLCVKNIVVGNYKSKSFESTKP